MLGVPGAQEVDRTRKEDSFRNTQKNPHTE
jgi:hypothetical protein